MLNWARMSRQTLVIRIFLSFLAIVLLFSVINFLSIHLFNRGLQNEVIQANRMMLQNTADRYRMQFERIRSLLFDLYSNEKVTAFHRQLTSAAGGASESWNATQMLRELRSNSYHPMYYLNNLFLHFSSQSVVFEKEGSLDAAMQFSRFYVSKEYPLAFWEENLKNPVNYRLHPEGIFTLSSLDASNQVRLLPYSFHAPNSDYQVIALLDAERMREAFYDGDSSRPLLILNEDGTLLYRSASELTAKDIPAMADGEAYGMAGGYYFFEQKDPATQLRFVSAVPYSSIASKIRNTSLTLMLISALALVLGILASVVLSRKINRPVKEMVSSLLQGEPLRLDSRIREFDLIQENIRNLMTEKESIHKELLDKRSLLTSFGYINKLKAITSDLNEWRGIAEVEEPFYIILYQLHFKSQPEEQNRLKNDRMAYYLQEYINVVMTEQLPSSHTFQMENNQILTLVRGKEKSERLGPALALLKTLLDRDNDYILVTIAASSVYDHTGDFHEAYREVLELAGQARPVNESQIIRERRALPAPLLFTVQQEQELYTNLQAGNTAFCVAFLDRMLDQFDKKEASIEQLRQLASGIIARVAKQLEPYRSGEDAALQQQMERMHDCCTLEQFKQFFAELFHAATAVVQSNKEDKDSTIAFVMDYLENRFADNVSLDLLAEKLNLSVAYLSVYIKEKTGANFSEHLNEIRIRKAKELLGDQRLSIQEISYRIGYRNATSFNRMFKKMTGIPPGEYRKHLLFKLGEDLTQETSN
ncbi:hypothetical protein J31TS4_10830 [Paenibacillus sp. J31TS4]|uniref:helix-turn-helix domain-containing protein n=1 Tax=Paenibacillus sp. J31TS4 TaxID=2807195 RepID=UPI001B0FB75E|nr:helix-turn-helix domain-containing protein [Paenibacillus sp. J31TS4]GIP37803.1 hypothetical protein J31TS4_10830 [Paenibacillus sp. J31TS4]